MKMRNPKLLSLLKKGCSVTFPSGVILTGLPDDDLIESGARGEDLNDYVVVDKYDLNEIGLEEALEYEESVTSYQQEDIEKQKEEGDWQ